MRRKKDKTQEQKKQPQEKRRSNEEKQSRTWYRSVKQNKTYRWHQKHHYLAEYDPKTEV